ncbi:14271_t:CDS:1, partial [Gigaspora rosea]
MVLKNGIYRSNKCQFQAKKAAKKSLEVHQKLRKNHVIQEINVHLNEMNQQQLNTTQRIIKKYVESSPIEKKRVGLVSQIEQLPQQEVFAAAHLFNMMRYFKGSNKNEILSLYLQNKAQEFISQNSYK